MGESELVLDRLSVDEALRLLGASSGGPSETAAPLARATLSDGAVADAPPAQPLPASDDWRATLRAAGASPESVVKKTTAATPATPADVSSPADASTDGASAAGALPAEAPPPGDAPAGLSVGRAAGELFGGPMAALVSLDAIAKSVASCTRCTLYSTATNPVPGEGNPDADFMCVGEAPGANEDQSGRPFVGAGGQLLTKILAAIDLRREDIYICNVLKHRPPGNRNPMPEEVVACSPYLIRQIELVKPKVILALGTFAAQTLLDTKLSIGKLRGQVHRYYGVPLIVTYHPAALLRNPAWKRPTWEDVQLARRILDNAGTVSGA
jgi:DNA polymerase